METCRIYLSGGMTNLSFEEQSKWRQQIQDAIKYEDYHYDKKPIFFNPVVYYNFTEIKQKSEKEIKEFELNNVRKSDLIIVNFNDEKSKGTTWELAVAQEHRIPIVGFGVNGKNIHPWDLDCCSRICDDLREVVEYVVDYYLN